MTHLYVEREAFSGKLVGKQMVVWVKSDTDKNAWGYHFDLVAQAWKVPVSDGNFGGLVSLGV